MTEETPEWKQEDVLRELVNEGLTYNEIAAQYEDATWYRVGELVRSYGLTPIHNRPKYQEGEVPVRFIDGLNIEHPLPVDIAEKYGISGGTPLRYIADPDDMDISVIIETGENVTGELSNERRATQRGTTFPTARYPTTLGHAYGLTDLFTPTDAADDVSPDGPAGVDDEVEFTGGILGGDDTDDSGGIDWGDDNDDDVDDQEGESEVTAEFEEIDDSRFRVRFSPSPTVWTPTGTGGAPDELITTSRKLTELYQTDAERSTSMPSAYQLAVPLDWGEQYALEDLEKVTQRLGLFEDERGKTHYGVVLVFGEEPGTHPGLQTGVHDSLKGVPGEAEVNVSVIYPVKALLHTVGIAAGDKMESQVVDSIPGDRLSDTPLDKVKSLNVNLVPGDGWIGLSVE